MFRKRFKRPMKIVKRVLVILLICFSFTACENKSLIHEQVYAEIKAGRTINIYGNATGGTLTSIRVERQIANSVNTKLIFRGAIEGDYYIIRNVTKGTYKFIVNGENIKNDILVNTMDINKDVIVE